MQMRRSLNEMYTALLPQREAELGRENTLYFDTELKIWREHGKPPPEPEAPLPAPPTSVPAGQGHSSFATQSALHCFPEILLTASNNVLSAPRQVIRLPPVGSPVPASAPPPGSSLPAAPPGGVRSRYVDTIATSTSRCTFDLRFSDPCLPSAAKL